MMEDSWRAESYVAQCDVAYFLDKGPFMKKLTILLPLLLVLALLQGCHSGSGSNAGCTQSSVRLVNGSSNTLDMVSSTTVLVSGVAYGAASGYASTAGGTTPIALELSGSGTASASSVFTLTGGSYTVLAYTSYSAGQSILQLTPPLIENQTAPAAGGGALLRAYEFSTDAGALDVYLAPVGNSSSSPIAANVSGVTPFYPVAAGAYHIWVTGAGVPTDLRLDIPSVAIGDQQVLTLALTSTMGGVLVDGLLIAQQGAVTALKNTYARVRVAASFTANGTISSAMVNGNTVVSSTLTSPAVSSYVLVPAGPLTISVNNGNSAISNGLTTASPGADLTLLAVGSLASPIYNMLNDDNTRPSAGGAKLRLVNGVNSGSSLSLTYNSQQIVSNVGFGTASPTANVTTGFDANLSVGALYAAASPGVSLQSQGVYSVFMLGDSSSPSGILLRDH